MAQNLPTAVTLATDQQKTFDEINSLFNNNNPKIALLNIGLEENKGNDVLTVSYTHLTLPTILLV